MTNLLYPKFMKNFNSSFIKGPINSDSDQISIYPPNYNNEVAQSHETQKNSRGNIFEHGALVNDKNLFRI